MVSGNLEKGLTGNLDDPSMYETLLKEDPASILGYYDCLEDLQWAIQHWYHADVAVIEEACRYRDTCVFMVVLENYAMKNNEPWVKTTRVSISPRELLGMYKYYRMIHCF